MMSLDKESGTIVSAGTSYGNHAFLVLPVGYVDRVDDRTVRWNLHVDENTANGYELNEIGMFSNNPMETTPRKTWLCAYRFFGDSDNGDKGIYKTKEL